MNNVITQAKSSAKRLRARLSDIGLAVSHAQSLEAVASVLSGMDWNRYAAQATVAPPPPPVPFVIARPGDGGWTALRIHDIIELDRRPQSTAIWCFPDRLNPETFSNGQDLHVLTSWSQLKDLSKAEAIQMARDCRGKILIVHAQPNFGSAEECLSASRLMYDLLRKSPLAQQALGLTWLDMHRWTPADGARDFLEILSGAKLPLRFHSQIYADLDMVLSQRPINVMCPGHHTEKNVMSHLQDYSHAYPHRLDMTLLGNPSEFDATCLHDLTGCVKYVRHKMGWVIGGGARSTVKKGTANAALKLVEAYILDEHSRRERQAV